MKKNIAPLLRVDHAQLANFGPIMPRNMQQSLIPDLTAHLCVEGRPVQKDIEFIPFLTRQNGFNDGFGF